MTLSFSFTDLVLILVRIVIVLAFLIVGWREVKMLFRKPGKNMGTGLYRSWAVGRTTMIEAWAGRVWLLPILWLGASIVLIGVIRPFDESERMPLNIRMLLTGQEYLILVMMWAMACLSLPRERERKIVITNASKPLSRLEMVLGKIIGFGAIAAVMLLVMGLASWGIFLWQDQRIRSQAAKSYQLQVDDFSAQAKPAAPVSSADAPAPPSEALKLLSEEGSLFAYNYITVPAGGLSVVGEINPTTNPPQRFMKGGSDEKAIYMFSPYLPASESVRFAEVGTRPYFSFNFPIQVYAATPPDRVQIRVTAIRTDMRAIPMPRAQEKVVTLDRSGVGSWEPDEPDELYSYFNDQREVVADQGEVSVTISCITPGVFLQILDGANADPTTGLTPQNAAFNVQFVPVRSARRFWPPLANPQMLGFETRGRQEISGPKKTDAQTADATIPLEVAMFRFSGKDLKDIPRDEKGNFSLALRLETYKMDNYEQPTMARVDIRSLDAIADPGYQQDVQVAEKRWMTIQVPERCLGNPDQGKRGDMVVMIACNTLGHSISMLEDSVRIELPQTPFVLNLFKSELVIFLETFLLIGIAVTCSVRVGWPVAMLLSSVCWMFGLFVEFITGLNDVGGVGGLAVLNYRPPRGGAYSMSFHFFDNLTGFVWHVLGVISALVPNFTIYQPTDYIVNMQNMPWSMLGMDLFWTVVFLVPFIGVAFLLFRKQELG